jgi:glycosyltransferase involved in cell wall biosynthesis
MLDNLCSVVIPVYNGAKYLVETMDSIALQEYPEMEVILIDDSSTDESPVVLSDLKICYPDIVHCYRNTKNEGLVYTYLRGIALASGKYIAGFGQDDIMLPNRISTLVTLLQKTGASMVCSNAFYLFENRQTTQLVRPEWQRNTYIPRYRFLYRNPVIGPSVMFRKQEFLQIDPSIFRFRNSMEWIHWFQYASMEGVFFTSQPLLYYRKHENNLSNKIFQSTEFNEYKQFCVNYIRTRLSAWEFLQAFLTHSIDKLKYLVMR